MRHALSCRKKLYLEENVVDQNHLFLFTTPHPSNLDEPEPHFLSFWEFTENYSSLCILGEIQPSLIRLLPMLE